jgi:hypothetical protein
MMMMMMMVMIVMMMVMLLRLQCVVTQRYRSFESKTECLEKKNRIKHNEAIYNKDIFLDTGFKIRFS